MSKTPMTRFDIYFPPETLSTIDTLLGDTSRAAWVRRAVEDRIERELGTDSPNSIIGTIVECIPSNGGFRLKIKRDDTREEHEEYYKLGE